MKYLYFLLSILVIFVFVSCDFSSEVTKNKPYCAVVVLTNDTYVEYWFPEENELFIFIGQMPKIKRVGLYDPTEDYLIFKRTGSEIIKIRQKRLERAPASYKLPPGAMIMAYRLRGSRMLFYDIFDY